MSELSSLLTQEARKWGQSLNDGPQKPYVRIDKDTKAQAELLEMQSRTRTVKRDEVEYVMHEGVACPVMWRRGGKVYIEIAEGIRKEVVE